MGAKQSLPRVPLQQSCCDSTYASYDDKHEDGCVPRRHGASWGSLQELPYPEEPHVDNLYDNFLRGADINPTGPCMGTRRVVEKGEKDREPFDWLSYRDAAERARRIGEGLQSLGLAKGSSVGIYSANRPDWMLSSLGMWSRCCVCVPLYDTLGEDAVAFQLNDADIQVVFVEASKVQLLEKVLTKTDKLQTVVQFESSVDEATKERFLARGKALISLDNLLERASSLAKAQVDPNDLAFIMYTSGTTGNPKGVMLTHRNVMASVAGGLSACPVNSDDRYLSYLPLAHIFETVMQGAMYGAGGAVGFYQGETKKILEDVQALRPTIFAGVPRIYQRIYDKATQGIEGKNRVLRGMVHAAMRREKRLAQNKLRHSRFAHVVCKKIRVALGGQVRMMISGAAPLPAYIQEFLQVAMQCPLIQGYGMTENSASATIQPVGDSTAGRVGGPVPPAEIKLVDVPDMDYLTSSKPPCGEICTRGPTVFKGYWKNETATNETLDSDGWLHTGDVGRWNEDGSLSIIDRKKNIFKLLQGEYIAAEKIEETLGKSALVGQVWVYGHSETTQLVAVVTPDFENFLPWAREKGLEACPENLAAVIENGAEELCQTKEVKNFFLEEFKRLAKEDGLKGFEIPKGVHIEGRANSLLQGFSIENDCLTPTFKLRRPQLLKRYRPNIEELYTYLGEKLPAEKK